MCWRTSRRSASKLMAVVYNTIRAFALEHHDWGELRGDAEPITPEGYEVWVSCICGARVEQWVSPADAEAICCARHCS